MMTDYLKELSTHYAQVRKRLRGEVPARPMPIPPPVKEVVEVKPPPEPLVVDPKRHFKLVVDRMPWEKETDKIDFKRTSYKDVLLSVSRETGVKPEEIMGRCRLKSIVDARRYFWWRVINECPHLSIAEIGRKSGHDHSTVLHAVGRYEEVLADKYEDFRRKDTPAEAKEGRLREKNGRFQRHRVSGRKWSTLMADKKVVE